MENVLTLNLDSKKIKTNKKLSKVMLKVESIQKIREKDSNRRFHSSYRVYSAYDVYAIGWA